MVSIRCVGCWWRLAVLRHHSQRYRTDPETWRKRKCWLAEERLIAHANKKHGR